MRNVQQPYGKKLDRYFIAVISIREPQFELINDRFEDLLRELNVKYIIQYTSGEDIYLEEVTEDEYKDALAPLN
jgi:hypothetical protein